MTLRCRTAELQLSQDILHRAQALAQIGSFDV